jgi:preprotein translocase subunit YajC
VPASKPAEQKPQQGLFGEGMSGFIYIGLFVLAIWFLVLRPQRKQEKELRKRQSELKAGDQVITTAGIHGKVVSIDASNILLQIADGVRVRFERAAIITVVKESKDEKAAKS